MRILIAEDDFSSRIALAGVLKKSGHDVVEAVNGADAWNELQKPDAPSLAILDWMMPVMDGLEVLHRMRVLQQTDRPPYIIMLTAKGEKSDIIEGLEAGADDYVTKPFDPGELTSRVQVGRRILEMRDTLATKVEELVRALEQIETLRGIIPICVSCKKIRDDKGYWNQLEAYISDRSEAEFTHGFCPECTKRLYPDLGNDGDDNPSKSSGSAAAAVDPARPSIPNGLQRKA